MREIRFSKLGIIITIFVIIGIILSAIFLIMIIASVVSICLGHRSRHVRQVAHSQRSGLESTSSLRPRIAFLINSRVLNAVRLPLGHTLEQVPHCMQVRILSAPASTSWLTNSGSILSVSIVSRLIWSVMDMPQYHLDAKLSQNLDDIRVAFFADKYIA